MPWSGVDKLILYRIYFWICRDYENPKCVVPDEERDAPERESMESYLQELDSFSSLSAAGPPAVIYVPCLPFCILHFKESLTQCFLLSCSGIHPRRRAGCPRRGANGCLRCMVCLCLSLLFLFVSLFSPCIFSCCIFHSSLKMQRNWAWMRPRRAPKMVCWSPPTLTVHRGVGGHIKG